MLLAIDVGNSSLKFALFDGENLSRKLSIATDREATRTELQSFLGSNVTDAVTAAIACSVVPEMDDALTGAVRDTFGVDLTLVKTSDDFGLTFLGPIDHAGTDRLVNSSATASIYGVPAILISFGTATTIDAIDRDRRHLGGLIAPGMRTAAKALELAASKLPEIAIAKPDNVVGYDTIDAIRSGIFNSQVGLIKHVTKRLKDKMGEDPRVIATGGFASMIADECDCIDVVDNDLTVNGLRMLYSQSS
ncbi:MAG: type III pantothenate kinase [Acidobacteria bacterium]|nr:type III pantothenate kinase [Acidobacteriota bacterium]